MLQGGLWVTVIIFLPDLPGRVSRRLEDKLVHSARLFGHACRKDHFRTIPEPVLVRLARLIRERADAWPSRFYSSIRQVIGQIVGKSLMKLSENDE